MLEGTIKYREYHSPPPVSKFSSQSHVCTSLTQEYMRKTRAHQSSASEVGTIIAKESHANKCK